jgi:hypothetical protein
MMIHLAAGAVFLVACGGGKTAKKVVDDHRAAADPILAQLAALAPVIEKAPPVTENKLEVPAGVKLDFGFIVGAKHNASVVYLPRMTAPCDAKMTWPKAPADARAIEFSAPLEKADLWIQAPACALRGEATPIGDDADLLEERFKNLEATKYVLVIKTTTMIHPAMTPLTEEEWKKVSGGDYKAGERTTFTPGKLAGEARLYELATQKPLGGFTFSHESAPTVKVSGTDETGALGNALTQDAGFGIMKTLTTLAPGTEIRI